MQRVKALATVVTAAGVLAVGLLACSSQTSTRPTGQPRACTVLAVGGGGWLERSPVFGASTIRRIEGVRLVTAHYPLRDLPASYQTVGQQALGLAARPGPLVVVGESAGGTIAVWLAARRQVDAAVSIGGPTDLVHWPPTSLIPASDHYPRKIGIEGQRGRYSPRRIYRRQRPVYQLDGTADRVVQREYTRLPGAHHRTLPGQAHVAVPPDVLRATVRKACRG